MGDAELAIGNINGSRCRQSGPIPGKGSGRGIPVMLDSTLCITHPEVAVEPRKESAMIARTILLSEYIAYSRICSITNNSSAENPRRKSGTYLQPPCMRPAPSILAIERSDCKTEVYQEDPGKKLRRGVLKVIELG